MGMRLFAVEPDLSLYPIMGDPVVWFGGSRFQLTAAHAFCPRSKDSQEPLSEEVIGMDDIDCNLDGMSDGSHEDDDDDRAMLRSGSVISDDLESDKASFIARPSQGRHP